MAAVVTINACETLVQIAAVEKAGEDLLFHRASEVVAGRLLEISKKCPVHKTLTNEILIE